MFTILPMMGRGTIMRPMSSLGMAGVAKGAKEMTLHYTWTRMKVAFYVFPDLKGRQLSTAL